MEYYLTKGDMLESQGKSRADVRWVDRQIAKGIVSHNENGFYFVMEYLIEENEALKKELEKSEPKCVKTAVEAVIKDIKRDDIEELEKKIKELESDLDFQISENERLEAKVKRYQNSIRNSYYYINDTLHKKVNRPDYKAIIKLEWTLPWEDNQ